MQQTISVSDNSEIVEVLKNVFIVGARRSGTTWTLSLLASHPEVVGIIHSHLIKTFKSQLEWCENRDPYRSIVVGVPEENVNVHEAIADAEYYQLCRQISDAVFEKARLAKPGASVIVESQPENIDNLDVIAKLYPDAYILHVVRDPRSVFASWKSVIHSWSSPDVFDNHPSGFCERWQHVMNTIRSQSKSLPHFKELQYEQLRNDGENVLQDLYRWLGLDDNIEFVRQSISENKIDKMRDTSILPEGFFRKGRTEGWHSELSRGEIDSIEYILQDLMDELGYKRVNEGRVRMPGLLKRYYAARYVYRLLGRISPFRAIQSVKRKLIGGS